MHICYNPRDVYLKMKCYILVYTKIYGGNINIYTMCTLCEHYYFPKNNGNCTFYKITIFDQNWKYGKSGCGTILLKTMCVTFETHAMHIEIHGEKHYV